MHTCTHTHTHTQNEVYDQDNLTWCKTEDLYACITTFQNTLLNINTHYFYMQERRYSYLWKLQCVLCFKMFQLIKNALSKCT